jgi:cytochrome P450
VLGRWRTLYTGSQVSSIRRHARLIRQERTYAIRSRIRITPSDPLSVLLAALRRLQVTNSHTAGAATAIRATLLYVLTNPRVYSKLLAEIDTATYPDQIITIAEARKLPYLQAVIKEGLRIFPPLVSLASKLSPPSGVTATTSTVADLFIPEGVKVAESRLMVQRRKDVFGVDANVFRPERWIEAAAAGTQEGSAYMKMERCLGPVFGTGRYGCLGKNIAVIELDKVFVVLLREFELVIADPVHPLKTACWGIHVQSDMWIMVRERLK